MKLILGSSSSFRRELAKRHFTCSVETTSPDIDEKAIRRDDPSELVTAIAIAKADALIPRLGKQDAFLITSDQVVVCEGIVREKPESDDVVRQYFESYSRGCPAETVTAISVTNLLTGESRVDVDVAKMYFSEIPRSSVDAMIAEKTVFTSCGGLLIEDPHLVPYITRIEGEKESIIGLPIQMTKRLLREIGCHLD
eukprot:TRINITY_DN3345_c0_g1_i2.p1 TRINITY_DN3345_c0_g1~~TRINITY_DN3345_c0_g1_i2.p1  ORF type:complete len:196 (+),score=47.06 TRINITY_DN3345_c0_g1_i2:48-635(+)